MATLDEKAQATHFEDGTAGRDAVITAIDPAEDRMTLQAYLALAAISAQYLAYVNTLLMPSTLLSHINADLGPDTSYTWITVSWNLCAAVMVTVGGRLSDIFGRRYFMMAGAVVALVGTVVGATAHSIDQMIVSGVLFGIGGGLQEMCYAALQEVVPMRRRVLAIGYFELAAIISFLSPIIAYAMIAHTGTWRTVYWYMFAVEAAALTLLVFCYKPPTFHTKHRADSKTKRELVRQMDWLGILFFTAACICFLLGVSWGGRQFAWASAPVISTIVIGAMLFVVLGFWEAYANLQYPMLSPKLFRNVRGFTMILVVVFVAGMLYYSMNVLWPTESALLFAPSDKPIIQGVYANMVSFGSIISGFLLAGISQKVGHERWQQVALMVVQTALIGSLATIGVGDKAQAIATILVLAGAVPSPQLLAFAMISAGIEDQVDLGVANGLASTFRLLGGAIATAIYEAILDNRLAEELPKYVSRVSDANHLSSSSAAGLLEAAGTNTAAAYAAALKLPGVTASIISQAELAVNESYVQSFRLVYLVALAFGGVAIVCALLTRSIPKEKKTMQRVVRMENEVVASQSEKI